MKNHSLPPLVHRLTHNVFIIIMTGFLVCIFSDSVQSQMVSTVNSTADDEFAHPHDKTVTPDLDESTDGFCEDSLGRCTLRAALEEAAYIGQPAYVTFNVPPPGIITIDDLQGILAPPDGSRIYGDQQNVEIFGNGAITSVLMILGYDTHVKGIQLDNALIGILISGNRNRIGLDNLDDATYIGGMLQNGIIISGDSNRVTGNVIGLDANDNPNGSPFGIFITGKENLIGGIEEGHRNIISSNDIGIGVYTIGGDSLNVANYIIGNQIGTDVSGEVARGNRVGIDIIGPNAFVASNTISGNTQSGILTGLDAADIIILKNYIGLDVLGQDLIPNNNGIVLGPGSIACEVDSNYIIGNDAAGIEIAGIDDIALQSSQHYIRGNEISMNQGPGILISGFVAHTTIGSGSTVDFPPNWIHHNHTGVAFATLPGMGIPRYNTIRKNIFNDHTDKAINIYTRCPTCQEQTFPPVMTMYEEVDPVTAVITGTHHDAGSRIDIYVADLNLSGHYEGGTWLGSAIVDANNDFILTVDNCNCDIVATATDPQNNTSEFTDGLSITTSMVEHPTWTNTKAFPNPFHEKVNITFDLFESATVSLDIFDIVGNRIEQLLDGALSQGQHETKWNPDSNPSGIYYYRLTIENQQVTTGRLIYVK